MNKNCKMILIILTPIITVLFSFIIYNILTFSNIKYFDPNFDEIENNKDFTVVWFCSDPHFNNVYHDKTITAGLWSDAIYDALKLDIDYAFCLGDITCFPNEHQNFNHWNQAWNIFYRNPDYVFGWNSLKDFTKGSYYLVGNHDANYKQYTHEKIGNPIDLYSIGNILFIGLHDSSVPEYGYPDDYDAYGEYMNALESVNKTLHNNIDRDVFILCHYPLQDTVHNTQSYRYALNDENNKAYGGLLEYNSVVGWLSGHCGVNPDKKNNIWKYNTFHMNVLSLSGFTHNSIFMFFYNNSKQVLVHGFNHDTKKFMKTEYFPFYLDLKYPYKMGV